MHSDSPYTLITSSTEWPARGLYVRKSVAVGPLRFNLSASGVGESAGVPGQRWQFTNKNGGPDKRFKNNRQLPIALYEEMRLTSASGLNEAIQLSRPGVGDPFKAALSRMASFAVAAAPNATTPV